MVSTALVLAQHLSSPVREMMTLLIADCNCGHGSCLPSGDCACSSGYVSIDNGTGGKQCEFCAVGYYANDDGSCKRGF